MDPNKPASSDAPSGRPAAAAPPAANRRVTARKVLRRPATVNLPGGLSRDATTWDLGADGMSLLSAKPISPGSKCTVAFEVPRGAASDPVSIPGKVVYCSFLGPQGFKVGMVFGSLDAPGADIVAEFLK